MTRDEFLGRLGELLACLPAEQVEETKAFYAEAIADRMEDGMSEEEAVAAMGAPGEVAEATLDDLPAVPRAIARTRRCSTALLWVLTAPHWARQSDKRGRKALMALGVVGFMSSMLLCGLTLWAGLQGYLAAGFTFIVFAIFRSLYGGFGSASPVPTRSRQE